MDCDHLNTHHQSNLPHQDGEATSKKESSTRKKNLKSRHQPYLPEDGEATSKKESSVRKNNLSLINANINDEKLNREEILIVRSINAIGCNNYGMNADLVHKYPYCDVLGMREIDPALKCIAKECDRSVEGSCIVHIPPLYTTGPKIASLVTQHGLGKPYDENVFARRIVKICTQESIVSHLYRDSGDN